MAEQTYERVALAKEQLEISIELFLSKRSMASALTLAGAAEEILGMALRHQGKRTTLQDQHSFIEPLEVLLRKGPYLWSDFIEEKNRARNAAKHMRLPTDTFIACDLEDEALWMIVRAYDNYNRLDLHPTDLMHEFEDWFNYNVVGPM